MPLNLSDEFERHAAECRDMAPLAYDPAYKAALTRLAENLEQRGEWLERDEWHKSHHPTTHQRTHPGNWAHV
jgi:hypothetical protein